IRVIEIVETQKFAPSISEVLEVIREHIQRWSYRRDVIKLAERNRREALARALKREQERKKQEHEREIEGATNALKWATEETQRLAKEIKKTKDAFAAQVEWYVAEFAELEKNSEAKLANLIKQHAESEARERKLSAELKALTTTEEEQQAAAKLNGS